MSETETDGVVVVAAVGDRLVGKSSLYISKATGQFPDRHVTAAEVEDCQSIDFLRHDRKFRLEMFEVSGDMCHFHEIRYFNYRRSDVFLLCFSVVRPESFANIRKRWEPEVRRYRRKGAIVLLVGTQSDLRQDPAVTANLEAVKEAPVTAEQGRKLARKIKARKYVECSSKYMDGLDELFDEIMHHTKPAHKSSDIDMCVVS